MSSIEKLKEKFYSTPTRSDITLEEALRLAKHYQCEVRPGGKHQVKVINRKTGETVPLPNHKNTLNRPYVEELQDLFRDETRGGKR